MIEYAVVIEFARNVVDDERHDELDDTCQPLVVSVQSRAYLNYDANYNKSLILTF